MGRNINTENVNKNYVLSKVSQVTIFSTYFDIPIETIQWCIDSGKFICSPIREDVHPTFGFRYDNSTAGLKEICFWSTISKRSGIRLVRRI